MADLEKLLELIRPERIVELSFRIDQAFGGFPLRSASVRTCQEFLKIVARFYQLLSCARFLVKDAPPIEHAEAFARQLLDRRFKGGEAEAYDRARMGWDGGLPAVLREMADAFVEQCIDDQVRLALDVAVDMHNLADRHQLIVAYLGKYRNMLPSGFSPSVPSIAHRLEEFVKAHIHMSVRPIQSQRT